MNLRTLSNFLSVAEIGSLKGAADAVNIAQPALTRQIALLEEEFGARLFLRHHRGVTLTEAGEELRAHAERILAEVAKARIAMSAAAATPAGAVSLGLPTAMRYVLSSAVVSAYRKAFPNVSLTVHEAFVHVIEDLLAARQIDVAILMAGARGLDNFDITPLVTEDVYLAGPRTAGLRLDQPVPLKKLAELPIILFSKRNQLRVAVENALARDKLALRPYLEVEGQPLTLDLMRNGAGYTIMPYCAVQSEIAAGEISGAPVRGLQTTWALAVNRTRAHAPALRELITLIRQSVDEHVKRGTWRAVRVPGQRPRPSRSFARPRLRSLREFRRV